MTALNEMANFFSNLRRIMVSVDSVAGGVPPVVLHNTLK